MTFFTDSDHPNVHDTPQGTTVYFSEEQLEEHIEVLIWNSYSPNEGEYNATLARFSIDRETKTLKLEHVSIKRKYSSWDEFLTSPQRYVTDRMKRYARKFMSQETDNGRWKTI